jgi:Nucleotidyltransferase of unknown function (DUF6036)
VKALKAHGEYGKAFNEVLARVQQSLQDSKARELPIRMYIAGGAALHLWTGARVTEDIDAVFSKRILFSEDIEVSYRDPDGRARLLYLDRNYNDTLGLLHEDAYDDSRPIDVPGIDKNVVEARVLSPLDLAVTKLARFADQDRDDIRLLAQKGLIDSAAVRKRAEEALGGYVGNTASVRASIDIACQVIDAERPARAAVGKRATGRPRRPSRP